MSVSLRWLFLVVSLSVLVPKSSAQPKTAGAGASGREIVVWLTEPARKQMEENRKRIEEGVAKIRERYPNLAPDELDVRFDFGEEVHKVGEKNVGIEVGGSLYDPAQGEVTIKITPLAVPHAPAFVGELNPCLETSFGLEMKPGDWDYPRWNGQLKIGYSLEGGRGEVKAGTTIDITKSADDFYDGEWQKPSEWVIVRCFEDLAAMLDTYGGGALNVLTTPEHSKFLVRRVGPEASWSLRRVYTNKVLFGDMFQALDNLAKAQAYQAEWRKNKIVEEAKRVGIDPKGKPVKDLIKEIHAKYAQNPSLESAIFKKKKASVISVSGSVSDHYCTNRPWISVVLSLPHVIQTGVSDSLKNLPPLPPPEPTPAPTLSPPAPK